MIVLIAGMPRSGSTFSFNVGREMLLARGRLYQEDTHNLAEALEKSGGADHVLLKAHTADRATVAMARHGALRTIITVRSIEDSVASWLETFGWSDAEAVEHLRDWIQCYIALRDVALIVPYEQVDRRPAWAAWRIARFLYPGVTPFEVFRIASKFSRAKVMAHADALTADGEGVTNIGFTYYDKQTYFHRRHVSGLRSRPAGERVPRDRINFVKAALGTDIAAAGL